LSICRPVFPRVGAPEFPCRICVSGVAGPQMSLTRMSKPFVAHVLIWLTSFFNFRGNGVVHPDGRCRRPPARGGRALPGLFDGFPDEPGVAFLFACAAARLQYNRGPGFAQRHGLFRGPAPRVAPATSAILPLRSFTACRAVPGRLFSLLALPPRGPIFHAPAAS